MSEVRSLISEADELKEIDSLILETFKHCDKMKHDIVEYSSDVKTDLMTFKENMENLANVQKDLSGLACAITRIDSYDQEEIGSNSDEILKKFDRVHESAIEDQYVDDEVERVIHAVDSYINAQEAAMDDDSEDLLVTSTTESYKDPLTKRTMEDPVKSRACNHSYERISILKYLQRSTKCPYSGCVTVLRREDLVDDFELKRKLLHMRPNDENE